MIKNWMSLLLTVCIFFASVSQAESINEMPAETELTEVTRVFMAGDSTMSNKEVKDYPETGWGVPFSFFFNESVVVHNYAKNGRSTRTFVEDNLWQKISKQMAGGDFVFIQFGHNDQAKHKLDRYVPPKQFKLNLSSFIAQVRAKGANPILMTPITRRYFNSNGRIKNTHPVYADLVRQVSKQNKVVFIDMEKLTKAYFEEIGEKDSALRYMHIPPQTHPNYPKGVRDNTHLNQLGAREVAQLVLKELKQLQHPLSFQLRVPDPKHLKLVY
ncbi:MAG: rhamnogalacturonan acetylesterase [Kangiellaceae bacterium]|nr:rhamnogalacturonan acetylesterase [Kangiellaceae bacterium]